MGWIRPALDSIYQMLGQHERLAPLGPSSDTPVADLERVRQAMLDVLLDNGVARAYPALHLKIHYAPSIQTLWYARCDLMAALACHMDESSARRQLAHISRQFVGLLPEALPAQHLRPRSARHGRLRTQSWV